MAGHSKWANIKHRKAAQDSKRGKIFTKVAREITVAAKEGGGDPEMNAKLRTALEKAKAVNLPNVNIDRAIKRGLGSSADDSYEAIVYEGYAVAGVAVLVYTLTDNKNRTVSDVRHTFTKRGGNLAESGSVAWMFERKGVLNIDNTVSEEELMEVALESGAEDIITHDDNYEVVCEPEAFELLRDVFVQRSYPILNAEVTMKAKNTVDVDAKEAGTVNAIVDILEDLDDVQDVYTNMA